MARLQSRLLGDFQRERLPGCHDSWAIRARKQLRVAFVAAPGQLVQRFAWPYKLAKAAQRAFLLLRRSAPYEGMSIQSMRLCAAIEERAGGLGTGQDCVTARRRKAGVEAAPEDTVLDARLLASGWSHEGAAATTPLIARQQEWGALLNAWLDAVHGQARVLLIVGEPGIGKTRLAEDFVAWLNLQGTVTAAACCYGTYGEVAFAPVATWLRTKAIYAQLLGLPDTWLTELARLLPELLVERPDLHQPDPLAESLQRQRLFEALTRAILSQRRPMLLLLDNLQWCDRETLAWLQHLIHFDHSAPILVVATLRAEELHSEHPALALILELRRSRAIAEIALGRLSHSDTVTLAARIANAEIPPATAAQLFEKTEGNPLFVVEMVRAGLDTPQEPNQPERRVLGLPAALPPSLQAVIEARLVQLSAGARELIGVAATIGRDFTFDVLVRASGVDEESVSSYLDEAWQRHTVRKRGTREYDFSHDRIRDVAYSGLSQSRRRIYHRRIATALQTVHARNLDAVSAQLAAHYEKAEQTIESIQAYRRASEYARGVGAYHDAYDYVNHGLEQLNEYPNGKVRVGLEIALLIEQGALLIATRGYADAAVQQTYARAEQLCLQAEHRTYLNTVRVGLMMFYIVRSELQLALALGEQLLDSAAQSGDPAPLQVAHIMLGIAYFYLGDFAAARLQLETGFSRYEPQSRGLRASVYGQDPGVAALSFLGLTLWFLGYPDQALERSRAAVALAQRIAHSYSLALSLFSLGWVHQLRREIPATREQAERSIALCEEQGFLFWSTLAKGLRSWVLAAEGAPEQGIAQLQEHLEAFRSTGAELSGGYWLALLAEMYRKGGNSQAGLAVVSMALATAQRLDERFYAAELWRLEAEMLSSQVEEHRDAIEARLLQALAIAERQGAKSLELRALLSFHRFAPVLGGPDVAQQRLAACYRGFTEGFDTPDLLEASAILAGN